MANEIEKGSGGFPAIPKDKIDAIINLSDDQIVQLKLVEGGFRVRGSDQFMKTLVGQMLDATPYLIRFENDVPHKLPHVENDMDIPQGYERRCDVRILMNDTVFGLSLAPTSMKYHLSPYLKYLRNSNLEPHEIVTQVISQQVSNTKGTWSVAVFSLAQDVPQGVSPEPPRASEGTRIPTGWR